MMKVVVNEKDSFDLFEAIMDHETFKGNKRRFCRLIVTNTDYDTLSKSFVDGSKWKIVDESFEYDWSNFDVAGVITDRRNGYFEVNMLERLTVEESLEAQLQQARDDIKLLLGYEPKTAVDVSNARNNIEGMYKNMKTVDEKISYISFAPLWKKGNHLKGEIYSTIPGVNVENPAMKQAWECFAPYDNSVYPDLTPNDPSWFTFNRPYHGTTKETAMPFMQPTNAENMYKSGEYMIYTNYKIYECIQDTDRSPDDYPAAWRIAE